MTSTAPKVRKRDTGERGNRGEFGTVVRADADVAVPEDSPSREVALPEGLDRVRQLHDVFDLKATRLSDGALRVSGKSRVITDSFEEAGIDPDLLCRQINLNHPDADAHIEDVHHDIQPWDDVVYSVSITPMGNDVDAIDRAFDNHPLAGMWSLDAERGVWDAAKRETAGRRVNTAMDDLVESSRSVRESPARTRPRVAFELYRTAAEDEAREAIDGLRDLGERNGATYIAFPGDDDPETSSLLSAYPVFYDAGGQQMDWHEKPEIQNEREHLAWLDADRDEAIVAGLTPDAHEDPELDGIQRATDHAYTYRCTPKEF